MQNENLFLFSFPSVSNFSEAKVTKNESRTKEFILFYAEEMEYMFKNIKTIILKNDK